MIGIAPLRRFAGALCVAGALWLLPALASAQAPAAKPTAAAFGAASGGTDLSRYKEESVPGGRYLVIAYGVMWVLVTGLLGRMLLSQARLEAQITELEERLGDEQS